MAKSANQKLKLGYLMQIMLEKTDEEHCITMSQIIDALKAYDIKAERKSLYEDLQQLSLFGIEVEGIPRGRSYAYHVVSRQFELAELKLLVDAIQSSKFISENKSNQLIKKLEGFASKYEAQKLSRQVKVVGRVKTMNESVYYNLDAIYVAISENRKIKFKYFNWNTKKEPEFRHNGEFYTVSPWALSRDDENCYLVAFDDKSQDIRYYRVDKMKNISVMSAERAGKELYDKFDVVAYSRKRFSMFDGQEYRVRFRIANSMAGVFIDRFGKDITFIPADTGYSIVNVDVALSRMFLSWVLALGKDVKIVGPAEVVNEMKSFITSASKLYE